MLQRIINGVNTFFHLSEEKASERKTQKKITECYQKSSLDLRL